MSGDRRAVPPSPATPASTTPPPPPSPPIGGVVGGLAGDIQDLVRGEIALARAEFDQRLHRIIMAAVWLMGGALLAYAGLVVVLQGAAFALAIVIPDWAASLVVGGIILIIGAILARSGLSDLSLSTALPSKTASNLEKDTHVIKEHI